jgi:hypothetical protein
MFGLRYCVKIMARTIAVPRSKKFANPFYSLLLVAGIAFALTATAYGVMAFREARPAAADAVQATTSVEHPLMNWMSQHGEAALTIELVALAIFTFGAIGTDDYWQRRARTGSGVVRNSTNSHGLH